MTRVRFAYGTGGMELDIPEKNLMAEVHMRPLSPLEDPAAGIAEALDRPIEASPLSEIAKGRKSACVVISDWTRPIPYTQLLPPLLERIERGGVPRDAITILIATGIHDPTEGDKLLELVGRDVLDLVRRA